MYYNFVKLHGTIRTTSAMGAGVTDKLREMSDIVKLVEAAEQEANDSNYGAGAGSKRKGVRS